MTDPNNRRHTAENDLGAISLPNAGEKTRTLELEQRDPAAELGPAVCGVRLARIQQGVKRHER